MLSMKTQYRILFTLSLLTFLSSCDKNQVEAEKSLVGNWKVVEIVTQYGEYINNSFVEASSISETGSLGNFEFGENMLSYDFIADGTQLSKKTTWLLDYNKVNSGFVKVPFYTLKIADEFSFQVQFDNSTINSQKNAKKAIFIQIPKVGDTEVIILTLEKE